MFKKKKNILEVNYIELRLSDFSRAKKIPFLFLKIIKKEIIEKMKGSMPLLYHIFITVFSNTKHV